MQGEDSSDQGSGWLRCSCKSALAVQPAHESGLVNQCVLFYFSLAHFSSFSSDGANAEFARWVSSSVGRLVLPALVVAKGPGKVLEGDKVCW